MKGLSYILKAGFYMSMFFLMAGIFNKKIGDNLVNFGYVGMLLLMSTPLLLVFLITIFYLYKKDYKKGVFALILFVILIINTFL